MFIENEQIKILNRLRKVDVKNHLGKMGKMFYSKEFCEIKKPLPKQRLIVDYVGF